MVMLNRFEVSYMRVTDDDAHLIDITDQLPRWADAPIPERTYFVASEVLDGVTSPVARPRLERGRADYLVIAPSSWLKVAKALLQHQRRQGLLSRAVSVESICEEFGFGEKRPQAIRDFLAHAYAH